MTRSHKQSISNWNAFCKYTNIIKGDFLGLPLCTEMAQYYYLMYLLYKDNAL
jgi:hypothetical protein